ncbi:MAG TPA: hypothetical protein VMZ31_00005 [Phycisphaerae bacterium]|nr:hypothetical protein [Phycisphaerae bacterium]
MWCRGWWRRVREACEQRDPWSRGLQALLSPLRTFSVWLSSRRLRPSPRPQTLSGILVRWHGRLRDPAVGQLRGLVAAALRDSTSPAFDVSLATASEVAIPEARETLLALLSDTRLANEPARSQLIRALGRLRDPSLADVFTRLLYKHAPAAGEYRRLLPTVHEAGWALCLCKPTALLHEVPSWLQIDPLFLSDVLTHGDRAAAEAVNELLRELEPIKRRFIQRNLSAVARVRLAGS